MKKVNNYYVTPAQTDMLLKLNKNAPMHPEYITRAIEIEAKIFDAKVINDKYYKELQAQEDKKWADIKAKRNNKRGRK